MDCVDPGVVRPGVFGVDGLSHLDCLIGVFGCVAGVARLALPFQVRKILDGKESWAGLTRWMESVAMKTNQAKGMASSVEFVTALLSF